MDIEKFSTGACPIARGLAIVGDAWSMLILRDAGLGMTRFDQFRASLGHRAQHSGAATAKADAGRAADQDEVQRKAAARRISAHGSRAGFSPRASSRRSLGPSSQWRRRVELLRRRGDRDDGRARGRRSRHRGARRLPPAAPGAAGLRPNNQRVSSRTMRPHPSLRVRTGLRPVRLDETTKSRVMPANAGIQNATSLSGFELFIASATLSCAASSCHPGYPLSRV